ncbi:unnamed protein product [Nippostrongylus brasiliensis]|uniref:Transmembrane protein n=1 Tax=Nippostrongylus brasiliensis TaxID=27835 RepID=A0A0N4XN89_NIPBR|nr:unnamed protein product [Nippostrongylus brasiliensis]
MGAFDKTQFDTETSQDFDAKEIASKTSRYEKEAAELVKDVGSSPVYMDFFSIFNQIRFFRLLVVLLTKPILVGLMRLCFLYVLVYFYSLCSFLVSLTLLFTYLFIYSSIYVTSNRNTCAESSRHHNKNKKVGLMGACSRKKRKNKKKLFHKVRFCYSDYKENSLNYK